MKKEKIAIIGGGNIGTAIAEGLLLSGVFKSSNIVLTKRNIGKTKNLNGIGCKISTDNNAAVNSADYIVLAVQPKHVFAILDEIASELKPKQILISVVSGVNAKEIQKIVGDKIALFRVMPNTAISIQESMTCISSNNASKSDEKKVMALFRNLGEVVRIEEDLMASATVLGACGVAYALRFIRAASQGGIEIGFDADIAQVIAAQTVKGAASLLRSSGKHPEREIDKVTTPQGCTIAGLNEMEHQGFSSALIKGLITSHKKIKGV